MNDQLSAFLHVRGAVHRVAVIYYSSTGTVQQLAEAVAEGAVAEGAEVRLLRVQELAPDEAIAANPAWAAHHATTRHLEVATLDDLVWADGIAFGTPTRFGNPAAQLKQFIDQAGGLWRDGALADKAATAFTAAFNANGGQESTILALNNVFYHWGAIIVPPGYTDPRVFAAGGNPYGAHWATSAGAPSAAALANARHQGERLARYAVVAALQRTLREAVAGRA